jgi:hypothetical protein
MSLTTHEQDARIEETSLAYTGASLRIIPSPDGSITIICPDGSVCSYDDQGTPPCRTHGVFDCASTACQLDPMEMGL